MSVRGTLPGVKRLLLVDDAPEDRALVRRTLRKGADAEIDILEADAVEAGI